MILHIIGKNIRNNLHQDSSTSLAPVLSLTTDNNQVIYGLGAIIHSPATIHYSAFKTGYGQTWMEAEDIEITEELIQQPLGKGYYIHTNTPNARQNQKLTQQGKTNELKLVLALREKRHAPAQLVSQIKTTGTIYLIYAAPSSCIKALPCGAKVWAFSVTKPIINNKPSEAEQLLLF
jgi:hypothetical protein